MMKGLKRQLLEKFTGQIRDNLSIKISNMKTFAPSIYTAGNSNKP